MTLSHAARYLCQEALQLLFNMAAVRIQALSLQDAPRQYPGQPRQGPTAAMSLCMYTGTEGTFKRQAPPIPFALLNGQAAPCLSLLSLCFSFSLPHPHSFYL